jgi:GH24 family phage-related lysozyme (muramidase)
MDFNARFYSPRLGRFIQPDSIIPDLTDSQAWNRYSYAINNPVKYTDPSGHYYLCEGGECFTIPNDSVWATENSPGSRESGEEIGDPNKDLTTSHKGLEFITEFEGVVLDLYNDSVGHCTIGIGHLVHYGPCNGTEEEFINGITLTDAYELLGTDLNSYEASVRNNVSVPLTQEQFDALVSFTYNIGINNFESSDLLILLNQGDFASIPSELNRWVKARDQSGNLLTLPGLVRRRQREGVLFEFGIYQDN